MKNNSPDRYSIFPDYCFLYPLRPAASGMQCTEYGIFKIRFPNGDRFDFNYGP